MKTKVAIACQGGGSQTAFTAGVLKSLCEEGVGDQFDIVSLSGTSGGALCAFFMWYSLKKGDTPLWKRLIDFWEDNMPQTPAERLFNDMIISQIDLVDRGMLPSFNVSPSSPIMKNMLAFSSVGLRKEFTDLRTLLESHVNFEEVTAWGAQKKPPFLIIGACNIITGKLEKFVSSQEGIRLEHLLASAAVPNIFPAVEIGQYAYWDGLFSDNPPVADLGNRLLVGERNLPQEIWVIKINPTECDTIPTRAEEITDRRNQLGGNISLFQSLQKLEIVNRQLLEGAFTKEHMKKLDFTEPVKIPRAVSTDPEMPYHIPMIDISEELQRTMTFTNKIDRSPENIHSLIADGEKQARVFLEARLNMNKVAK